MTTIPTPTDAELEILQLLWKNGPSTVRYINEKQNDTKVVGYTTTLKLMQIMNEKGILNRDESSRTHIYTPAVKKVETQNTLLNSFIRTAFGGSASNLVLQALGNHSTDEVELKKIKELIEKIEKGDQ